MHKKTITFLMVFTFTLIGISGCSRNTTSLPDKVTVGIYHWPGSAALYVADAKGYFKNENLGPGAVTIVGK